MPVIGNVFDKFNALRQPSVIAAMQGLSGVAKDAAQKAAADETAQNEASTEMSIETGKDGKPVLNAKVPLSDPGAKLDDIISGLNEGVSQNLETYKRLNNEASDEHVAGDLSTFGGRFRASQSLGANPVAALIDAVRVRSDGPGGHYHQQLQEARDTEAQNFYKANIKPQADALLAENKDKLANSRLNRLLSKDDAQTLGGIDYTLSQDPEGEAAARLGRPLGEKEKTAVGILQRQQQNKKDQQRFEAFRSDKTALGQYAKPEDVIAALGSDTKYSGSQISQLMADWRAARTDYQRGQARADRAANAITTREDVAKSTVQGIMNGDLPPDLSGMARDGTGGLVRKGLVDAGFNLSRAQTDWKATQAHIKTLNGAQQTRLNQAVNASYDQLDVVEKLYDEWKQVGATSGVKAFNKASLAAAKQLPGKAGATAQALDGQLALLTGELGNTLMGGNSPTDHALQLSGQLLKSDWNDETFKKAIKQLRTDLRIRKNSLNAPAAGTSANNPYAAQQPAAAPEVQTSAPTTTTDFSKMSNEDLFGVLAGSGKKQ